MTVTDAAEKVANSAIITAIARVAMFLTPIIVTIGLFVLGYWLNTQAATQTGLANRLTTVEQSTAALDRRQSVTEATLQTGRTTRDKQIADISSRVDQNQNAVEAKLDKVVDGMTLLSNQLSGLAAVINRQQQEGGH